MFRAPSAPSATRWLSTVALLSVAACAAEPEQARRAAPPQTLLSDLQCAPEPPPPAPIPISASPRVGLGLFAVPPREPGKVAARVVDLGRLHFDLKLTEIVAAGGAPRRQLLETGPPPIEEDLVQNGLEPSIRQRWAQLFSNSRDIGAAFDRARAAQQRAGDLTQSDPHAAECARVAELQATDEGQAAISRRDSLLVGIVGAIRAASPNGNTSASPETRFVLAYVLEARKRPEEIVSLSLSTQALDLYGSIITDPKAAPPLVLAARMERASILLRSDQPAMAVAALREVAESTGSPSIRATAAYQLSGLSDKPSETVEWLNRALSIAGSDAGAQIIHLAATCELARALPATAPGPLYDAAVACADLADTSPLVSGGADPLGMAYSLAAAIEAGAVPDDKSQVPNGVVPTLGSYLADRQLAHWDWLGARRSLEAVIRLAPNSPEAPAVIARLEKLNRAPHPKTDKEVIENIKERARALFLGCADEVKTPVKQELSVTIDTTREPSVIHAKLSKPIPGAVDANDLIACLERGQALFESLDPMQIRLVSLP